MQTNTEFHSHAQKIPALNIGVGIGKEARHGSTRALKKVQRMARCTGQV